MAHDRTILMRRHHPSKFSTLAISPTSTYHERERLQGALNPATTPTSSQDGSGDGRSLGGWSSAFPEEQEEGWLSLGGSVFGSSRRMVLDAAQEGSGHEVVGRENGFLLDCVAVGPRKRGAKLVGVAPDERLPE